MHHSSDGDPEFSPRIGHAYQAEIPSVIAKSDQLSLRMNPADSEDVHDKSLSFSIDLPISDAWSDADTNSFVLGLFIFRKNFTHIKQFIENKGMGEMLSFYYGKFYKTDGYLRWSKCRKKKGRKCMIGHNLFAGPRQHELLSRLIPHVSEESQEALSQISKSFMEGGTSLEDYISFLKSTVGLGVLVEAVGIGKEKGDLTRLGMEPGKDVEAFPAPACKSLSSLGLSEIIQYLTGFRLSKTKSNDLFWEAVWPRLLGRGWHSEQPKYRGYVTSNDNLVFLIPGVEKFSRRKLVKGDHYFDSVSDVLRKVVAEPNILLLKEEEEEAKVGSCNEEEPENGSNEDDLSDDHRQCYLKPRSSTYSKDHIKFLKSTKLTVIDTNRYSEGKLLKLKAKQLKYLPVELEDASTMTTSLLRESKGGSSIDDSPRKVEAKRLICDKKNINKTDGCRGVSNSGAASKKTHDNLDNNRLTRIIKHQFNQRVRSGDSNHAAVPIKRRKLTACVKSEKSRIVENSSGCLGFSRSSSFLDANQNVCGPVSHQQNENSTSSADRSVEEDDRKSIINNSYQRTSVSCVKVEKSESFTFNIPQAPSKSENSKTVAMAAENEQGLKAKDPCLTSASQEVVQEPLRIPCDVGSLEQQPDMNPRRQSSRNRPLTVRALECIANEFLHVPKRQKKKDIQTHQDPFNPCRKART
ncbi:putative transcription regulator Homeodomain-LIKE family [Medicago truncatula]|uniref:Putative transcription regulator Homeodomain-LIKE family n=1 Tax=Medicago truncatula TaxID=3880 RepID=A0A396HDA8_MEDTR|nr:putative transcription regulator Homeodomain-LIKE family [Medicago truncatula]